MTYQELFLLLCDLSDEQLQEKVRFSFNEEDLDFKCVKLNFPKIELSSEEDEEEEFDRPLWPDEFNAPTLGEFNRKRARRDEFK